MIRVMTYNVRYFGHALPFRGMGSSRKALCAIASAISKMEQLPHLICLQEVETRSLRSRMSHTPGFEEETQLEALSRVLDEALTKETRPEKYQAYYFPAHSYQLGQKAKIYTTGLALLARSDIKVDTHNASTPFDITHRRKSRISTLKQSRICAHATVSMPSGDKVDLFNTHLSLPQFMSLDLFKRGGRMGYGENQSLEIDRLTDFVTSQAQTNNRYLILGDFNSLPSSPAYERMLERLPVCDPFPDAVGTSLKDLRLRWPTAGFLHLRMRLDHIFAGKGLECVDFEDTHPFGVAGRWHGLSDHVPLVGRFKFRPQS